MLERAVIGSVISGDVLPSQLELTGQAFGDPLCGRLFALTQDMERSHRAIDLAGVCMADESLDTDAVIAIMGERCISEVLIGQHCARLRSRAEEKRCRAMIGETLEALRQGGDCREVMTSLSGRITAEFSRAPQDWAEKNMDFLIVRILEQLENPQERPQPVPTGIEMLDTLLAGGFRAGDLAIVAALTSVGKSAMLAFMMRSAAGCGKRILLISCEMSEEQNAERYMAAIGMIPMSAIVARKALSEEESIRLSDGMALYHPENIHVVCSGVQTVASVRREALRMKSIRGLDLIVVDYLQRLRPERPGANRAEEVGSIAAGLKALAVDLNVPVLTAAQFNREAAKGRRDAGGRPEDGVPALHQLRDSSQIEDEANTVIVLDEPVRTQKGPRYINAHIAKNRSGPLGAIRLRFDGETMTYRAAEG